VGRRGWFQHARGQPGALDEMTIDRATLLEHLAQAERHVAQCEAHIGKQEALIADLERDGHDAKDASALLATFRQTQAQHVLSVERLLKELQQQRKRM
jgi:Fic family protein